MEYFDLNGRKETVPVHKKNDKQRLNNYQPTSLLRICSKILGD